MRERVIETQADPYPYPLRESDHKNKVNQLRKSFLFTGHYLKKLGIISQYYIASRKKALTAH